MNENPFTLMFGKEPELIIRRGNERKILAIIKREEEFPVSEILKETGLTNAGFSRIARGCSKKAFS